MGSFVSIVLSSTVKWPNERDSIGGTRTPRAKSLPQGSLFFPFPSIVLPISFTLLSKLSPHTDYPGSLQSPVLGTEGWMTGRPSALDHIFELLAAHITEIWQEEREWWLGFLPPLQAFPVLHGPLQVLQHASAQLGPCLSSHTAQWLAMPGPG